MAACIAHKCDGYALQGLRQATIGSDDEIQANVVVLGSGWAGDGVNGIDSSGVLACTRNGCVVREFLFVAKGRQPEQHHQPRCPVEQYRWARRARRPRHAEKYHRPQRRVEQCCWPHCHTEHRRRPLRRSNVTGRSARVMLFDALWG